MAQYMRSVQTKETIIETACRLASEAGLKPVWFAYGVYGNEIWGK